MIEVELQESAVKLAAARRAADRVWVEHQRIVCEARDKGLSLSQIAALTGVSKGRISQIVKGRHD